MRMHWRQAFGEVSHCYTHLPLKDIKSTSNKVSFICGGNRRWPYCIFLSEHNHKQALNLKENILREVEEHQWMSRFLSHSNPKLCGTDLQF